MKKVSIEDIAKACGVSRGTVSRAFNQRSDINKGTREKVLEVAAKMNYFPNSSARGLAKGCSECIGIVVPDLMNPFLAEMVTYIERSARRNGLSATLALHDGDEDLQRDVLLRLASGKVDAIVITPCESTDSVNLVNRVNNRLPVVALKRFEGMECDTVVCNDSLATRQVIGHLAELGHSRIAYVSPSVPSWSVRQRLDAYEETLQGLGLSYASRFECEVSDDGRRFTFDRLLKDLRRLPAGDKPTAIFAYDDIVALHLIKALVVSGHRVPENVSVAGLDNISVGELASVPLTSSAASSERLGEVAIEIILGRLKSGRQTEVSNITLIPSLHIRSSTSRPSSR